MTEPTVPTETQIAKQQAEVEKIAVADKHADNIQTIQALKNQGLIPASMANDADLIKLEEDIKAEIGKDNPEGNKVPEEKPKEEPKKPEEKTEPKKPEEKPKEEPTPPEGEGAEKAEGMFYQKKQQKQQPINTLEEGAKYIKDKYDIDVEDDPKNFTTFFGSVNNWRKEAQQFNEVNEKLNNQTEFLKELPQPIKTAMQVYIDAGDYKQAFTSAAAQPDFNKNWGDHSQENLINFYFPKEGLELMEAWEETDDDGNKKMTEKNFNKEVDRLHGVTEKMYNNDKNSFTTERAAYARHAKDNEEKYAESVQSSVEFLAKAHPTMGDDGVAYIKKLLTEGDPQSNILGLVFDNGKVRKDATTKLAFFIYGEEQLKHMVAKARNKSESAAGEKFVAGADKKPKPGKGGSQAMSTIEAEKVVKQAMGLEGGTIDPYRHVPKK